MAHSHTSINIHYVFSPLKRHKIYSMEARTHLQKYLRGICCNLECICHACFVMPDHVHILVQLPAKISVAAFAKKLKANSSRHLNTLPEWLGKFTWQEGYGAFSCSYSALHDVCIYIQNQEEHHKIRTYEEEYHLLMKKHNIKDELNSCDA